MIAGSCLMPGHLRVPPTCELFLGVTKNDVCYYTQIKEGSNRCHIARSCGLSKVLVTSLAATIEPSPKLCVT
jgi:hypothetical protein